MSDSGGQDRSDSGGIGLSGRCEMEGSDSVGQEVKQWWPLPGGSGSFGQGSNYSGGEGI